MVNKNLQTILGTILNESKKVERKISNKLTKTNRIKFIRPNLRINLVVKVFLTIWQLSNLKLKRELLDLSITLHKNSKLIIVSLTLLNLRNKEIRNFSIKKIEKNRFTHLI